MKIRQATTKDAQAISALISSVSHYFTLHPRGVGADGFLKTIKPLAIAGYIEDDKFMYFSAFIESDLAGVVAIRDNEHLYHLFVSPKFQRRGLANKLWTFAKEDAIRKSNTNVFTVNSTEYAVPVYEKFGFRAVGQRVEADGIAFVPMKLTIDFELASKTYATNS
jgi:ribosomal protein S18 acetylase RimI-like enzyme